MYRVRLVCKVLSGKRSGRGVGCCCSWLHGQQTLCNCCCATHHTGTNRKRRLQKNSQQPLTQPRNSTLCCRLSFLQRTMLSVWQFWKGVVAGGQHAIAFARGAQAKESPRHVGRSAKERHPFDRLGTWCGAAPCLIEVCRCMLDVCAVTCAPSCWSHSQCSGLLLHFR